MPYINFPPLHPNCDCQVNILDENGDTVRVLDSEGKFIMEELDDFMEYVKSVLGKAILGDFSDAEYTPEALILSSIIGFTGADVPMDIRDVVATITDIAQNGLNEENKQDLIWNGLAIIPFAGATKYVKKIPGVEKHIDEAVEGIQRVLKHGDEVVEVGLTSKHKIISTEAADKVNDIFKNTLEYEPPYKPGTTVTVFEVTEKTKFVRVYDKINSRMRGGWVMKEEDIIGLTPQEIQNKFALPNTPSYICDVELEIGTRVRTGEVNPNFGFDGGGQQYDLIVNGKSVGTFSNERSIG